MKNDEKKIELPLSSKMEGLLFASGEPVTKEKLAKALNVSIKEIDVALDELVERYTDNRSGLTLLKKASEVQLVSAKELGETVAKFLNRELSAELSTAAAEVLSVVAYRGPVTRAQIEQIRGVNCSFTLRNLAMRGLVERKDNPSDSRSFLYETSFDFLKQLGLEEASQLPDYSDLHTAKIITEESSKLDSGGKALPESNEDGKTKG